jgi:hypothetical protein
MGVLLFFFGEYTCAQAVARGKQARLVPLVDLVENEFLFILTLKIYFIIFEHVNQP